MLLSLLQLAQQMLLPHRESQIIKTLTSMTVTPVIDQPSIEMLLYNWKIY